MINPLPALVGRSREQQRLQGYLADALASRGKVVLVAGDAGIGKTSLVDWLADTAGHAGATVLRGQCYDLAVSPPYGPWLEALATRTRSAGAPDLPSPLQRGLDVGTVNSQSLLFDQMAEFLVVVTADQSLVLVLEDLQWADASSLELLRFVGREIKSLGLLLIATYRPDELTPQHPLSHRLPLLVREARAERIDLPPLGEADVHMLVADRYALSTYDQTRLVKYLLAQTAGNPFYVTEVLRVLETERVLYEPPGGWRFGDPDGLPVPSLVQHVIDARLANLDTQTLHLLEVAAAIGQDVQLDVWQSVSEIDPAQFAVAVDRAIDAHLMLEASNEAGISFTHALVRDALYHNLGHSSRRDVHRRAAEVLIRRTDSPPSLVASHLVRADDPRAIDWLVRAGEQALAVYAAHDAVAALTQAHELAGRLSQHLPLAAYRARASASSLLGDFDRARRDYELILERARTTGDQHVEWQALLDLGLLWAERDYERTGVFCRSALELARQVGEKSLIARSLNRVANWHANLDAMDAAVRLHEEALSLFVEADDREGVAETLDFLGMASYLNGDLNSSTSYYERATAVAPDFGDRQRLSSCLSSIAFNGGDLDTVAIPVYREGVYWTHSAEAGLELARDIGWRAGEAYALFALSATTSARGELGCALRAAESALSLASQIRHQQWTVAAGWMVGRIRMELFDLTGAAAGLEHTLALARVSGSVFWTNTVAATLASLEIARGGLDRAAAILGTVGLPDTSQLSLVQRHHWSVRAELEMARGQPARAMAILDRLSDPGPNPPLIIKLRADAIARLGRLDEAEPVYQAAVEGATLFGFRPLLWRIQVACGELYLKQDQTANAAAAFDEARATIEQLALTIDEQPVRDSFRATALARLPAQEAPEPLARSASRLSRRELDVLRLLADGKSDREIADTLVISPRTVMRHVTGILNKLSVPSRTAAATVAIRQGIV